MEKVVVTADIIAKNVIRRKMMAIPRIKLPNTEPAFYHVTNRTVQQDFLIEDMDKKVFMAILAFLVKTYFVDVLAFQFLNNHYHLIFRIMRPEEISLLEIEHRFYNYYRNGKKLNSMDQEKLLNRWSNISKFMQDLNQRFARYMNRKNDKKGHFWQERFHGSILEGEKALLACIVYVDLNAIRAGIVDSPKDYSFGSIGYMLQNQNESGILNLSLLEKVLENCMAFSNFMIKKITKGFSQIPKCIRKIYSLYIQYIQEIIDEEKRQEEHTQELCKDKKRNETKPNIHQGFLSRIKFFSKSIAMGSVQFLEKISEEVKWKKLKISSFSIHYISFPISFW